MLNLGDILSCSHFRFPFPTVWYFLLSDDELYFLWVVLGENEYLTHGSCPLLIDFEIPLSPQHHFGVLFLLSLFLMVACSLSEAQKPEAEDVFMEEDVPANNSDQERIEEDGGWSAPTETPKDEILVDKEEEIVPDETIHEVAVGKGLSGALKLLKERGSLKETVEWGGRNMDKKKSKLVGIYDDEGQKEIRIERTDEYGRIVSTFAS